MKYVDFTIIFLLIVEKSVQKLLMPEKIASPISDCIIYILNKYFNNGIKISIRFSNEYNVAASEILNRINLPVLTNADDTEMQEIDQRTPDDVTVIMDQSVDISILINNTKWDAETQFLVIAKKFQTSEQDMIEIFQKFWANNIVNVLLLATDNDNILIYTFIPFNRHDCAVHRPVLLTTWTSRKITPSTELIKKERITDLNGCVLNASVVIEPPKVIFPNKDPKNKSNVIYGIEGSVLMEISYRMNFKLNIGVPRDGKKWGRFDPAPHGIVGELFYRKIHFACGMFTQTLPRYKNLDVTVPVGCEKECLTWVVPTGAKAAFPAWVSLLIEGFSEKVWYLVAITAIFTAISFRIFLKATKSDRFMFSKNLEIIFFIFRTSLGPSVKLPKSSVLRTIFSTWLLYSFVLSTAYEALMGSKLTVPFRKHNIETLRDLLETDLQITGPGSTIKLVAEGLENEDVKEIVKRYVVADFDFNEAVKKIVSGEKVAFLWISTLAKYTFLHDPKAKELMHLMTECGHEYYSTMLMQKNSPLTASVNKIIQIFIEAGIICKWRKEFVFDLPEMDPPVQKLSLDRMMGSFVILGAGLGASLFVFAVESVWYLFSMRKALIAKKEKMAALELSLIQK